MAPPYAAAENRQPQLLLDPQARDAIVAILLEGRWPDRPARDPLAAVQALQGLALAPDPDIAAHTLPRKGRRPRKRPGLPPAPAASTGDNARNRDG